MKTKVLFFANNFDNLRTNEEPWAEREVYLRQTNSYLCEENNIK